MRIASFSSASMALTVLRLTNPHQHSSTHQLCRFLFVDCATAQDALDAKAACNNYSLDKNHSLAVDLFLDYEKILSTPKEFIPPTQKPYKEQGHLREWLADESGRDQFLTFVGEDLSVMWNERACSSFTSEYTKNV